MGERLRVLFVCSRNAWRSRTAETIYRHDPRIAVRSAGTEPSARHQVTEADLLWADLVFTMEQKHTKKLRNAHPHVMSGKEVFCLDIADHYQYMDEELVDLLRCQIDAIVDMRQSQ